MKLRSKARTHITYIANGRIGSRCAVGGEALTDFVSIQFEHNKQLPDPEVGVVQPRLRITQFKDGNIVASPIDIKLTELLEEIGLSPLDLSAIALEEFGAPDQSFPSPRELSIAFHTRYKHDPDTAFESSMSAVIGLLGKFGYVHAMQLLRKIVKEHGPPLFIRWPRWTAPRRRKPEWKTVR